VTTSEQTANELCACWSGHPYIKASRTIFSVGVDSLTLFATPYPAYTESQLTQLTTTNLHQIQCSGLYQYAGGAWLHTAS